MDLANYSTESLIEQAEYWRLKYSENKKSKLAKQFWKKFDYHARRRPDYIEIKRNQAHP